MDPQRYVGLFTRTLCNASCPAGARLGSPQVSPLTLGRAGAEQEEQPAPHLIKSSKLVLRHFSVREPAALVQLHKLKWVEPALGHVRGHGRVRGAQPSNERAERFAWPQVEASVVAAGAPHEALEQAEAVKAPVLRLAQVLAVKHPATVIRLRALCSLPALKTGPGHTAQLLRHDEPHLLCVQGGA